MTSVATLLAENPHFPRLDVTGAESLLARAVRIDFKRGQTLLEEGRSGNSMIVLEKGSVEVRRGGKELAALGPGSTFGEMALLDPAPRSATVLAASDGVAWELGRDALWDMLAQGEPAAVRALQGLTATVCARLEAVNRLVQDEVVRPRGNVFSRLWKTVSGGLAGKR